MKVKTFLELTKDLPDHTIVRNSGFSEEYTRTALKVEDTTSIIFHQHQSVCTLDLNWDRPLPEQETTLGMMRQIKTEYTFQNANQAPQSIDVNFEVDVEDGFVYAQPEGIIIKDNIVIFL